jgi:hypothetical protein
VRFGVERLHDGLPFSSAQSIGRDLAGDQGEPASEIVAAETAKATKIVLEEQQPEIAEHIIDLVVREGLLVSGLDCATQCRLVFRDELPPPARIARKHRL